MRGPTILWRALALKQALQLHLELSEVTVSKLLMKLRALLSIGLGGKLAALYNIGLLAIEQDPPLFLYIGNWI